MILRCTYILIHSPVDPLPTRSASPVIKVNKSRFLGYNLLAVGLALGANFLGNTSWLMSLNVDLFRTTLKADIVYPINSLSRYIDDNYEFLYPAKWIKDPNVFLIKTVRNREDNTLTYLITYLLTYL